MSRESKTRRDHPLILGPAALEGRSIPKDFWIFSTRFKFRVELIFKRMQAYFICLFVVFLDLLLKTTQNSSNHNISHISVQFSVCVRQTHL